VGRVGDNQLPVVAGFDRHVEGRIVHRSVIEQPEKIEREGMFLFDGFVENAARFNDACGQCRGRHQGSENFL